MQIAGLKLCKRLLRAQLHQIFDMQLLRDHILQWGVDEKRDYVLKHVCSVAVHTDFELPPDSCASFWADTLDGRTSHHHILRMWHNVVSTIAPPVEEGLGLHSGVSHGLRFMGIVVAQTSDAHSTSGRPFMELPSQEQANTCSRIQPWVHLIVQGADASQISSTRGVSSNDCPACKQCHRMTCAAVADVCRVLQACVDSLASAHALLLPNLQVASNPQDSKAQHSPGCFIAWWATV